MRSTELKMRRREARRGSLRRREPCRKVQFMMNLRKKWFNNFERAHGVRSSEEKSKFLGLPQRGSQPAGGSAETVFKSFSKVLFGKFF